MSGSSAQDGASGNSEGDSQLVGADNHQCETERDEVGNADEDSTRNISYLQDRSRTFLDRMRRY